MVGLLSNETTLPIAGMAMVWVWTVEGKTLREAARATWALWAHSGVYLLACATVLDIHATGPFAPVWSLSVLAPLAGRSALWAVNILPWLWNVRGAGPQWRVAVDALLLAAAAAMGATLLAGMARRDVSGVRLILASALWFLGGLIPVLPFAHDYAYYNLAVPALGLPVLAAGLWRTAGGIGRVSLPALALAVGALGVVGVWGPGGLNQVDAFRGMANAAHEAYILAAAAQEARPGALSIYVDTRQAQWLLDGGLFAQLAGPVG